jgi:hypothetical protein
MKANPQLGCGEIHRFPMPTPIIRVNVQPDSATNGPICAPGKFQLSSPRIG